MLPQLRKVADAPFLLRFAERIAADTGLPAGNDKATVIAQALTSAVAKASFFLRAEGLVRAPDLCSCRGQVGRSRKVRHGLHPAGMSAGRHAPVEACR